MNAPLLMLDTQLFLDACDVKEYDDPEQAQEAVAEFLSGEALALEDAP